MPIQQNKPPLAMLGKQLKGVVLPLLVGCFVALLVYSHHMHTKSRVSNIIKTQARNIRQTTKPIQNDNEPLKFNPASESKPNKKLTLAEAEEEIANDPIQCEPITPCEYDDEVGLRVIVMTQKRLESLSKTLESIKNIETDGDEARLEIWVDRLKNGSVSLEAYQYAKDYHWPLGKKRVHVWKKNVGIIGQWIDSWKPKENTNELALLLEDDIDVSPYFYRWARAAHTKYGHVDFISGYVLQDEHIYVAGSKFLKRNKEQIFMYRFHGPWGFLPHPARWRTFQTWFHKKRQDPEFQPYVKEATTHDGWFHKFVKQGTQDTMWEMWYYRYAHENGLWAIHNNLRTYAEKGQGLSYNRQEPGAHFHGKKGRSSSNMLLQSWQDDYTQFPENIRRVGYNGKTYDYWNLSEYLAQQKKKQGK